MKTLRKKGSALLLGLCLLALALPAHVTAVLILADGSGNSITVADNGACVIVGAASCIGGIDLSPAIGQDTVIGSVGAWTFNVSTGTSHPILPLTPGGDIIDLNSVNTSSAGAILAITWEDTGFSPSAVAETMTIGGTQAPGSSVDYKAWMDPGNVLGAQTVLIGDLFFDNTVGTGSVGFSGAKTTAVPPVAPYSLKQKVTLTHLVAGLTSFDASITPTPVPEPGSLLLLGTGLLGFANIARKKFFKK